MNALPEVYNEIYIALRKRLKKAGIEQCGMEARLLIQTASGKTKEEFCRDLRLYASDATAARVRELAERREKGEPLAYITGEWEFYGLPMAVTRDVLIPRTDTEVLAEAAILYAKAVGPCRILDLCSGSGCIGIAVAANVPGCRVVLTDISEQALRVSRINILKNQVSSRVTAVRADALQNPPLLLGNFDVIVCNPPYIPTGDIEGLDSSVREYEPAAALDGGADGLEFYRSILSLWTKILKPGGCLMFECGAGQAESVRALMRLNGFEDVRTLKDTLDIERVVAARKITKNTEDHEV